MFNRADRFYSAHLHQLPRPLSLGSERLFCDRDSGTVGNSRKPERFQTVVATSIRGSYVWLVFYVANNHPRHATVGA